MTTFYVSKSGSDSNSGTSVGAAVLTIGKAEDLVTAAVAMGYATNTISIGDGTYTESVVYTGNNCTFTSTSQDRTKVIITQSSEPTFKLNEDSTGNVFKHLTIQNTSTSQNDSGIWGGADSGDDWASYTVEDCIFDCALEAIRFAHACTIKRTKFLINSATNGSSVYGIRSGTAASGEVFTIEACLFVGWDKWAVNGSGGYMVMRNCTLVLDASSQSTSYLLYWSGTNNQVYNTIFYGGATSVDYGLRFQSANSSHTAKNCIAFGALRIPYNGTGSPTVTSQLETNTEVVADGNNIFTSIGSAGISDDYTIDADGLARSRGLAAELGSDGKDVDGNDFDSSNPNIGCYATVASGYTHSVSGVATANLASMNGVAKADMSNCNGA